VNRPRLNGRSIYDDWKTSLDAAGLFDVRPTGIQRSESNAAHVERPDGLPGKEGLMITVEYPPGSSDPIHRHNAHAFVYVLEGSIVMQVRGGKEVTLTPGQTFYEGPSDVHVVGRNASQTKPAKFVVFLVKDKGAPVLVPAK
jgi:quercetin dioxygenase-like cupin family protein